MNANDGQMTDDIESWLSGRTVDADEDDGKLSAGTVIGEYRIVALLGRGGFADVYRAVGRAREPVAIKILHRLDDKSRARLVRESEILMKIRHPHFPRLFCFGSCGERPYMVLELLQSGCDLPSEGRMVVKFLGQVISAVEELHRHGYIHRDIKPQNILYRQDATPVLIDFGMATYISSEKREMDGLSVEGDMKVAVGTPGYSAPEQFSGQSVGREADVHSIGMLIKECYNDKEMPKCWRQIYLKATASDPESRYRSMRELKKAISLRHWRKMVFIGMGLLWTAALVFLAIKFNDGGGRSMPENMPRMFKGNDI